MGEWVCVCSLERSPERQKIRCLCCNLKTAHSAATGQDCSNRSLTAPQLGWTVATRRVTMSTKTFRQDVKMSDFNYRKLNHFAKPLVRTRVVQMDWIIASRAGTLKSKTSTSLVHIGGTSQTLVRALCYRNSVSLTGLWENANAVKKRWRKYCSQYKNGSQVESMHICMINRRCLPLMVLEVSWKLSQFHYDRKRMALFQRTNHGRTEDHSSLRPLNRGPTPIIEVVHKCIMSTPSWIAAAKNRGI